MSAFIIHGITTSLHEESIHCLIIHRPLVTGGELNLFDRPSLCVLSSAGTDSDICGGTLCFEWKEVCLDRLLVDHASTHVTQRQLIKLFAVK